MAGRNGGRHATRTSPRGRWATLGLVAAALVVFGVVFIKLYNGASEADAAAAKTTHQSAAASCAKDKTVQVTVTVVPELAPIVEAGAARATGTGVCANYTIEKASSKDTSEALDKRHTTVWIPDSQTWLDTLPLDKADDWTAGVSIAHSPVLLAGTAAQADEINLDSWGEVLRSNVPVVLSNPDNDTASRLAYYTGLEDINNKVDIAVGSRLIFMTRYAAKDVQTVLAGLAADPSKARPFPISEQAAFAWNVKNPGRPLTVHLPKNGTPVLDYPIIYPRGLDQATQAAVDALAERMVSGTAVADFTAAGFRTFEDKGGPSLPGDADVAYTPAKLASAEERRAAVAQWDTLRTDMRMLAVMDVSGSMKQPSGTKGLSRWDVLASAAQKAMEIMPAGSEVGAWVFSTHLKGNQPWLPIASVAPLDSQDGLTTHRQKLMTLVNAARARLGGDTALYVTTINAYRNAKASYDSKYVNSIVVLTDGANDYPGNSYSLSSLLRDLKKEYDPNRPIRVITIGMGDADPSALKQIAKATGGTSYIANTGDDIQRVLVEALLGRPLPVEK